jgi:hypothetical protein
VPGTQKPDSVKIFPKVPEFSGTFCISAAFCEFAANSYLMIIKCKRIQYYAACILFFVKIVLI